MVSFRKSVLCTLCDFKATKNFNLESETITFTTKFCDYFLQNTFDVISMKYLGIIKSMLLFDEWIFIVTKNRLIKDDFLRSSL